MTCTNQKGYIFFTFSQILWHAKKPGHTVYICVKSTVKIEVLAGLVTQHKHIFNLKGKELSNKCFQVYKCFFFHMTKTFITMNQDIDIKFFFIAFG